MITITTEALWLGLHLGTRELQSFILLISPVANDLLFVFFTIFIIGDVINLLLYFLVWFDLTPHQMVKDPSQGSDPFLSLPHGKAGEYLLAGPQNVSEL